MTELTIQFNYVRDCVVLPREDFVKYAGTILPGQITRNHADNMIAICRPTVSNETRSTRPQ